MNWLPRKMKCYECGKVHDLIKNEDEYYIVSVGGNVALACIGCTDLYEPCDVCEGLCRKADLIIMKTGNVCRSCQSHHKFKE